MPLFNSQEILVIERHNSIAGPLDNLYDYCKSKCNPDGTVQILDFDEFISLEKACQLIIDFSESLEQAEERLKRFKESKYAYLSEIH